MTVTVLDAPSNLGLRMPAPGVVPGCYKLPWALRDHGLLQRLRAVDAGAVVPGRYDVSGWTPGDGVFNAAEIARYTTRLADRVAALTAGDGFLLVLGGDCGITLGTMLALRRRGRYGIVYVDGHADYRHVGNAPHVDALGGEALAVLTGRGQPEIGDLEGVGPYVRASDVAVLGLHEPDDPDLVEARSTFPLVLEAREIQATGAAESAGAALSSVLGAGVDGVWVHVDVDALDESVMPAVDSPSPGGLQPAELTGLLRTLTKHPGVVGMDVTIFDPDLDPDGTAAALLTDIVVSSLDHTR